MVHPPEKPNGRLPAAESNIADASERTTTFTHELRQYLQTICLLQALLKAKVVDESGLALTESVDDMVSAMARTLDAFASANESYSRTSENRSEGNASADDTAWLADIRSLEARGLPKIANFDFAHQKPQAPGGISHKAKAERRPTTAPTIFVVDDDETTLLAMQNVLEAHGHHVEAYSSAEAFLATFTPNITGCLLVDGVMPGMTGLDLLRRLRANQCGLPAIVVTGHGDIPTAINAMKAGAFDFLEKPAKLRSLLASIDLALKHNRNAEDLTDIRDNAMAALATLTPRERDVMDLVIKGTPNKEIAYILSISRRTVETHRASVMRRTRSASLAHLVRLVMRAQH